MLSYYYSLLLIMLNYLLSSSVSLVAGLLEVVGHDGQVSGDTVSLPGGEHIMLQNKTHNNVENIVNII